MPSFAVTFDYLCPFARIGNEVVVRAMAAGAGWDVEYRAFSLSQVHLEEDAPPVWESTPRASGVLALEWGLAVRDNFPEQFPQAHLALFAARHDQSRNLNEVGVLREAVASAGVDPAAVEAAVAGGEPAKRLAEDHQWGRKEHEVFGVPTFVAGDRAVFVRLMDRPRDDVDARDTLERVLRLVTGWAALNEFKATRIPR